jgi:hypothetical protein
MITRSSWPIDTVGVEARPFYINFRAVNPVIWLRWASLLEPSPKQTPHPLPGGRGLFLPRFKARASCGFNHSQAARCLSCFSGLAFGSPFNTSQCTCTKSCDGEGSQIFSEAGG